MNGWSAQGNPSFTTTLKIRQMWSEEGAVLAEDLVYMQCIGHSPSPDCLLMADSLYKKEKLFLLFFFSRHS